MHGGEGGRQNRTNTEFTGSLNDGKNGVSLFFVVGEWVEGEEKSCKPFLSSPHVPTRRLSAR